MNQDNRLVAGQIGSPRGLRGEVSVIVRTDLPEDRFFPGATLATSHGAYPALTVEKVSTHGGRLYVYFSEIKTRETAEKLKHLELFVEPASEEDAWYPSELRGLPVVDSQGIELGFVSGMQVGLAQDLLEVEWDSRIVLVPMVQEILTEVDLKRGLVTLDPPEGLFTAEDS